MNFKQYDVVIIKKILRAFDRKTEKIFPRVGDVATILEIYKKTSLGFELECSNEFGEIIWLEAFSENEIVFEKIVPKISLSVSK